MNEYNGSKSRRGSGWSPTSSRLRISPPATRKRPSGKTPTFSIGRGEFVAVIGPNGAGKTTLFRLLLGLQQPLSGAIKIFGAPPKRGNPQIGYVPQRHIIDSETNVESLELVRLGLSGKKWGFNPFSHADRDAAFATLESVGASELAHRPLGVLSGGELQRIFLAEALVSNPACCYLTSRCRTSI